MSGNLSAILNAARNKDTETEAEAPVIEDRKPEPVQSDSYQDQPSMMQREPPIRYVKTGRGRPATGKRSDPDFEKSGVLLRKTTRKRTAAILLNYPNKDFSDLVDELLTEWNNRHPD